MDTNKSNPSQDDFKGFSVDIVKKLAKKMEFEYKFVVLEKGGSGSKKDGKWNGLVGALINKVSYTTKKFRKRLSFPSLRSTVPIRLQVAHPGGF